MVGDRSYRAMWRRYKVRVLIAMSAQAFAQLVSFVISMTVVGGVVSVKRI